MLGNKKVHKYQVPSQKKTSPILQEINSTFKELAIFPSRIKGIDSRKFPRIANTISDPKIGHVAVRRVFVTADGKISPESFYVTKQT